MGPQAAPNPAPAEPAQRFTRKLAAIAVAAASLAGCDAGSPTYQLPDGPPLHVERVLVATSVADGVPQYEPLAADGSTKVLSTTSFRVQVDRPILPITATRQALCVQPLLGLVVGLNDCRAGVFLSPTYDPVRREIVFRLRDDVAPLAAGTKYQLSAYVAIADDDPGLRTIEGVGLEKPVQIELGVADDPGGVVPPRDPGPTGDHFCAPPDPACTGDGCARGVASILGGCAFKGCHGATDSAMGLDMSSAASLLATAIGRTAHETQTGEHARDLDQSPPRFGRAMPILDPKVAGNSYLVYKLLANPATPLERPLDPADITRLQSEVVVGAPMPPDNAPLAGLRAGEAEWIAEWLMQGAPVATCK
jgi:hypothetical protein